MTGTPALPQTRPDADDRLGPDERARRRGCALCGAAGEPLHEALEDRHFDAPGRFALRHCPRCALAWLDPVPEDVAAPYRDYYTHEDRAADSLFHRAVLRGIPAALLGYGDAVLDPAERRLGRCLACVPPLRDVGRHAVMWLPAARRGRLLDVGCGAGDFLVRMRELGWQVSGLEPDPLAAARAAERLPDAEIVAGSLLEAELPSDRFDAITLSHVVEHLADPRAALERCAHLLAPGGWLVLATPNLASLGARSFGRAWLHWDPPRHRQLFSPESLGRVVREAGLSLRRVATPASTAHFVWQASAHIERAGRLPGLDLGRGSPVAVAESLAFWAVEYALTIAGRPVGEEVLVIAEKPR